MKIKNKFLVIRKFFLSFSIILFTLVALFGIIKSTQNANAQIAGDLALNKPIISVSSTAAGSSPVNAVDGNVSTFWTSGSGGAQWLGIDLGSTVSIGTVTVKWGNNLATNYNIELSDDGVGFTVVRSGINGDFNSSILGSGRYLLIRANTGSSQSNYQLASLEVFAAPVTTPTATISPRATATPTSTPTPTATPTPTTVSSTKFIINHQNVTSFNNLPDTVITQASALRMMFRHASVGSNINDGLNALTAQNTKYNRTNWSFQARGNPGWQAKVDDFDVQVALQASTMDVLSQKFCYIDQGADWNYYRTHMEALMAAYPTKKFIWWTMPIMTSGDPSRDAFNNNLRTYAATHNIILFDLAAIESHDPAGNAITSGGLEAMYPAYSSDGGHLTAAGSQRVAQAFWVMMARISGWSESSLTPTVTTTPTATPTAAPTPVACQLTSASWSVPGSQSLIAPQNSTVSLVISGNSSCANKQVSLKVVRNGLSTTGGNDVAIHPVGITLSSSGTGTSSWVTEYNPLILFTSPQYYFTASAEGGNTIDTQANLLTVTGLAGGGPQIGNISDNISTYTNSQVPKYEKFESTFQINNTVATNLQMPYDETPPAGVTPKEGITVNGEFLAPGETDWAKASIQPAFYYQDFDYQVKGGRDWIYPTTNYSWKLRFSPTQEGTWQYRLTAQDAGGKVTSSTQTFIVSAADPNNHGFVKVSKTDTRYFEYQDGTYFPGLSLNTSIPSENPITSSKTNLPKFGQNGIQLLRVWLSGWSINSSAWNPWNSHTGGWYGGYIPFSSIDTRLPGAPGSDVSMELEQYWNPCIFTGWLKDSPALKPNTKYRVSIKYLMPQNLPAPKDPTKPYGLVAKTGFWLWGPTDNPPTYCFNPGTGNVVSNYASTSPKDGSGNPQWSILTGEFTSDANRDFMLNFYLTIENIDNLTPLTGSGAFVQIDRVDVNEVNPDGSLGPNVIEKSWMAHHQYMEQKMAYAFDKVLEEAEKDNVYFKLVIQEKNEIIANSINYDGKVIPNVQECWDSDPKNDPAECPFMGNKWYYGNWGQPTKVYWLQQAWWRYLQARWGYSPNVHSWELNNEGDPYNGLHYTLTNNLGKYMHQFGPNSHLVTTSNWHSFPTTGFWGNNNYSDVDYADVHQYILQGTNLDLRVDKPTNGAGTNIGTIADYYDSAEEANKISQQIGAKQPFGVNKPVMRGETGFVDSNWAATTLFNNDTQGIWLHKYIWGGINSGGLIESYWYGGEHIYPAGRDLRPQYGIYYNFIKDIPLSNGNYQDIGATSNNTNIRAWGQKDTVNGKAHVWIDNKTHTWGNVVNNPTAIAVQSGTVTIPGMPVGSYTVTWVDTYTGTTLKTDTSIVDQTGNINLTVLNLDKDIAVKVENTTLSLVCTLASAAWNTQTTTTGTIVNLNVTGDANCANKQVNFEVRRNGSTIDDIQANTQPAAIALNAQSQGSGSWVAEFNPLRLFGVPLGDPQYYFRATTTGGNTIESNPRLLTVTIGTGGTPTPTLTPTPGASSTDWPQVQKDANHSGYVAQTVLPPTSSSAVLWKRDKPFPVSSRVQPVIAQNLVFLPSNNGSLYALSTTDGHTVWSYKTGSGLVNSAAYDNGRVFFGSTDHNIYAVNANDGSLAWKVLTGSTVKTAPVIANGIVYIGSSDGNMYAINGSTGAQVWKHDIGAPIYDTAAIDNNRVFFGGMDSVGYALNISDGSEAWHIKIPGQGFRDRWTVAGNGKVLFTPMLYGEKGASLTEGTYLFNGTANPLIYNQPWSVQRSMILSYLQAHPYNQPVHVVNQNTGAELPAPILYGSGGSQAPHAQPVLLPNGNADVIYRRSFGELSTSGATTYSALYVGELTSADNDILPIDTCVPGGGTRADTCGNYKAPLISDESSALMRSGDIVYVSSGRGDIGLDTINKTNLPFSSYNTTSGGIFGNPPIVLYPGHTEWICINPSGGIDTPFSEVNSDCNDIKRPTPIVGDTFYILYYSTIMAVKGTIR
ncbi:MAG: PQQ-binding-like beta-propeller repeat protein [Candidatus Daviesbacteria bacterium]|nr:PQQ-binding-like beta-propeller repeat protein [Candidatus Daviesbacteria bacterium]